MSILFRDYETRSTLNLPDVGAWKYSTHATTDVWCCAFAVDDGPIKLWVPGDPTPAEFVEAAQNPAWLVSAFNDNFERLIEQHIMASRYGWPLVPIERHRCTQAAALSLALPAKLKTAALALELEQQKSSDEVMRSMARPRKPRKGEDPNGIYWHDEPERLEQLQAYCKQDVATERELHGRTGHPNDEEQALWQLDATINDRGIYLDAKLLDAAIRIGEAARAAINAELRTLTGGAVETINQPRLAEWLAANGCEVTDLQKTTLKRALTRNQIPEAARRAIGLRLDGAHAAVAKYQTMRDWLCEDGRIRGALKYHGAATGRWTSYGVQVQNFKRPLVNDMGAAIEAVATGNLDHVKRLYPQPMSVVGDVARAVICAQPGHRLIAADFSGIESRLTAWLASQQSKLDQWAKFDRTGNPEDEPYYVLGHKTLGFAPERARAPGKTADLAFGYKGGEGAWRRLAPEGDNSTPEQIKQRQYAWRNIHPVIVQLWSLLEREAIRAVHQPGKVCKVNDKLAFKCCDNFLKMRLPSGRKIAYLFPRLETNDRGNVVVVFKDNAAGKFVDCRHGHGAWAGTWVENAVQATARDLFAAAMLRLETAGYPITLHIHDEIVAEVRNGIGSAEEFLTILVQPPAWAAGLPIAAKVRNGPRFCKINKPEKPAAEPVTQADLDEINAGLQREGVEPIDIGAGDTATPWTTPVLIEVPSGTAEFSLSEEDRAIVRPEEAPRSNGRDRQDHQQHHDDKKWSDYGSGEKDAGKSYAPVRTALYARGYRVARTFNYTLPNGKELFYEDRYELQPQIKPTKERPHKTSRFWHRVNGEDRSDTGPRRVIYNWPAIMAAGPGAIVFITEGANKSEPLNKAGLHATAVPYHQWGGECASALVGYELVYLADHNPDGGNDPGAKYAAAAQKKLASAAASFRIVPALHLWKHLPAGGRAIRQGDDVKDWLKLGGDPARLIEICREIPADGIITAEPYGFPEEQKIAAWQWLYGRHLLRGEVAGTAAMGGTGKSTLAIVEALAMTSGRALLGQDVPGPLRVVLVNLEDTRNTMDKRIAAVMRHYGLIAADIGDRLIIKAKGEIKIKVARQLRSGDVERNEPIIRALTTLMVEHRAAVLSIDSFVRTHRVNENDNSAIQEVIECFEDVATEAQCAVHLWHHTRKAGGERATVETARGAIAFVDACRSARILETMPAREHAQLKDVQPDMAPPGFYFRAFNGKRNFAPPADQSDWHRLESVVLHNGDNVGVAVAWQYPATWADLSVEIVNRILDEIEAKTPSGQRYSSSNAAKTRAAWSVVKKHCPDKTQNQCRQIVATWVTSGLVYEAGYEDPVQRRPASGLYVRNEKRPS